MLRYRPSSLIAAVLAVLGALTMSSSPAAAIVGGSDAQLGQFPYLVSLEYNGPAGWHHLCGGVILDATTILTAAHCVHGRSDVVRFRIRYGSVKHAEGGTTAGVSEIREDQSYDYQTIANDLAILKAAKPLILDGTEATPIALPEAGSDPVGGTSVQAAGWGKTVYQASSLPRSQQQITLPVVDRAACTAAYSAVNTITATMMCAGTTGQGTCQGDSGGPLVEQQSGTPVVVGITSWAVGCAWKNYPSVFASVATLRGWIDTNRTDTTRIDANRIDVRPIEANEADTGSAVSAGRRSMAEPAVGSDHGCPFDSVCLYQTSTNYQTNEPDVIDDLALMDGDQVVAVPAGSYAEIVNNTGPAPQYSAEATIALGLLGLCVFLPEDTQGPDTEAALNRAAVDTIVVGTTQDAADALTVPCPTG